MQEQLIISGFGGQGVMSLGQMLTYAGMKQGHEVSWLPAYGPEMRGGAAYVHVIISDEAIGSPIITDASCLMALNLPSLDAFEDLVVPGGIVLVNSSLIERKTKREDVRAYYINANDEANELGNARVAGMVMLGAYLKLTGVLSIDAVMEAVKTVLGEGKLNLLAINQAALERGAQLVS